MIFPLNSYGFLSSSINLTLALLIGVAFGFVLEKAGLGNAKKLVDQFLLKDLAVFKVMFSAIITAMVGLFFMSAAGWVNLDLIQFPEGFWLPQLIGGLMLGAGFAIAGYCPGTTLVGMATGKLDALSSFFGLFLGSWLFVLLWDDIESFYLSTPLGSQTLNTWLDIDFGTIVFMIVGVGLVGFIASEKIEAASLVREKVE